MICKDCGRETVTIEVYNHDPEETCKMKAYLSLSNIDLPEKYKRYESCAKVPKELDKEIYDIVDNWVFQ